MTVKEIDGLLQVKDEKGDVNTIYPVTKAENVEGLYGEDGKIPADQLPEMDYLPLAGGNMKGDISMPNNTYIFFGNTDVYEPLNGDFTIIPNADMTVSGAKIKDVGRPVNDKDAANKKYVDDSISDVTYVKKTTKDFTCPSLTGATAVAYGGGWWLVIEEESSRTYISKDGVNWEMRNLSTGAFNSIIYNSDNKEFLLYKKGGSSGGSNVWCVAKVTDSTFGEYTGSGNLTGSFTINGAVYSSKAKCYYFYTSNHIIGLDVTTKSAAVALRGTDLNIGEVLCAGVIGSLRPIVTGEAILFVAKDTLAVCQGVNYSGLDVITTYELDEHQYTHVLDVDGAYALFWKNASKYICSYGDPLDSNLSYPFDLPSNGDWQPSYGNGTIVATQKASKVFAIGISFGVLSDVYTPAKNTGWLAPAYNPDTNTWLAVTAVNSGGKSEVLISKDRGKTWGNSVTITEGIVDKAGKLVDIPASQIAGLEDYIGTIGAVWKMATTDTEISIDHQGDFVAVKYNGMSAFAVNDGYNMHVIDGDYLLTQGNGTVTVKPGHEYLSVEANW